MPLNFYTLHSFSLGWIGLNVFPSLMHGLVSQGNLFPWVLCDSLNNWERLGGDTKRWQSGTGGTLECTGSCCSHLDLKAMGTVWVWFWKIEKILQILAVIWKERQTKKCYCESTSHFPRICLFGWSMDPHPDWGVKHFEGHPSPEGKKNPHCEEPLAESCCYLLRCSQSIPHLSLVQNRRSLSVSPWWDLILNVWRTSKFAVFTTPSVEVLGIFEMMNKFAPRLAHWKPQQADTLLTIITALWNSEYKENKVLLGVKSYSSDVWDLLNHQIHCLSSANLFSVAYSPMHSSA